MMTAALLSVLTVAVMVAQFAVLCFVVGLVKDAIVWLVGCDDGGDE